jgi:hypothetical protein
MPRKGIRQGVKQRYRNLRPSFRVDSANDARYNCAADAAGDKSRRWWPWPNYYWPVDHDCQQSIDEFVRAFATLNYFACIDESLEPGWEKIALFGVGITEGTTKIKHVARQIPSGKWRSKLGPNEDIIHETLQELEGSQYGGVVKVLRRQVPKRKRKR